MVLHLEGELGRIHCDTAGALASSTKPSIHLHVMSKIRMS